MPDGGFFPKIGQENLLVIAAERPKKGNQLKGTNIKLERFQLK
jgi:hypothetical protein